MADVLDTKSADELAETTMELGLKYSELIASVVNSIVGVEEITDKDQIKNISKGVLMGFAAGHMQKEFDLMEKN